MEDNRLNQGQPRHERMTVLRQPKDIHTNVNEIVIEGALGHQKQQPKYYRHVATRSWTLVAFLVAMAGCIGYFELVRVSEYTLDGSTTITRRSIEEGSSYPIVIVARQDDSSNLTSVDSADVSTTSTYTTTAVLDPPPESFLSITSASPVAITITSAGITTSSITQPVTQETSSTIPGSTSIVSGDPAPSNLLSLTHFPSTTSSFTPSTSTQTPGDPPGGDELTLSSNFTTTDYFLAMYLPTLLTVFLQSFWTIIFAATKMMEPFYQLARKDGVRAKDSLLAEYLSSGLSLDSLRVFFNDHPVMFCTSAIQLLMGFVVTLAGESMTVKPTAYCSTAAGPHEPCSPRWFVNTIILRVLQGLLATIFILVFCVIVLNWRRKSGVFTDPSSIASMAALLSHHSVIDDLRQIPPSASKKEIRAALAEKQYMLSTFQDPVTGQTRYGVIRTSLTEQGEATSQGYTAISNPAAANSTTDSSHPSRRRILLNLRDIIFLLIILALFGIIISYRLMHSNQPLNNFLNSNTFGPRFILSGTAVLIGSAWKRLEREIRIMEPYRCMARQLSPAETTVLAKTTGSCFTTIFVAFQRRWFFVSFIAAVTVASEFLVILVPGIPFSTAQIRPVYLASSYASLIILVGMATALVVVLVRRRGDPEMPREPDTLASVWLYLCASNMVASVPSGIGGRTHNSGLGDTEEVKGKLFWFGCSAGVDGQRRWMVDADQYGIAAQTY